MYFVLNRNICVTNFCVVGTQCLDVKKLLFIIWCGVCGGISYILTSLCTQLKYWSNFISQSSVNIMTRLQAGWPFFSSHRVQTDNGLIQLLSSGYRGTFRDSSSQGVKLAAQLHLFPRLRVCGAMPSLTHTFPLHLVTMPIFLTEHRDNFNFYVHKLIHM